MLREPPDYSCVMAQQRIEQITDMATIPVADMALGAKPRRDDSIGGTRDTIDFMHQIESSLQTGSGGHFETIRLEKGAAP